MSWSIIGHLEASYGSQDTNKIYGVKSSDTRGAPTDQSIEMNEKLRPSDMYPA